jgi:hypothetical protein
VSHCGKLAITSLCADESHVCCARAACSSSKYRGVADVSARGGVRSYAPLKHIQDDLVFINGGSCGACVAASTSHATTSRVEPQLYESSKDALYVEIVVLVSKYSCGRLCHLKRGHPLWEVMISIVHAVTITQEPPCHAATCKVALCSSHLQNICGRCCVTRLQSTCIPAPHNPMVDRSADVLGKSTLETLLMSAAMNDRRSRNCT